MHPQVSYDFNISPKAPALPDFALTPSYASLPVAAPRAQIPVATLLPSRKRGGHFYILQPLRKGRRPPVQIGGPLGREEAHCTYWRLSKKKGDPLYRWEAFKEKKKPLLCI